MSPQRYPSTCFIPWGQPPVGGLRATARPVFALGYPSFTPPHTSENSDHSTATTTTTTEERKKRKKEYKLTNRSMKE